MKTVPLNDLLTDDQIEQVQRIIQQTEDNRLVRRLTEYFKEFSEQLESKGILPEYLAWVIYAKAKLVI